VSGVDAALRRSLGVVRELLGGADNENFVMLGEVADGDSLGAPDSGNIIATRGSAAQGKREHHDGQPSD
jgi:hypothetical protein